MEVQFMLLLPHTGSVLVNFTSLPTRILLRSAAAVKQAGRRRGIGTKSEGGGMFRLPATPQLGDALC